MRRPPSPDERKIVYFKYNPSPENPFLGEMWARQLERRRCPTPRGERQCVCAQWSPGGTKISYYEMGRGTYVVDVTTGEITTVLKDADSWPEWVDDHTWIVGGGVSEIGSGSATRSA